MPVNSYLYEEGETPILGYKEGAYINHLLRLRDSEKPVSVVHMTNLQYPSYLILNRLALAGLADVQSLERTHGTGGKAPKGYTLSDTGEAMLKQHAVFLLGEQETNVHQWRELINFWRDVFPSRYMQYYASLLMVESPQESQKEAIAVLGEMDWFDAPKKLAGLDLAHPIARAMVDAFAYGGAPAAIGMDTANPHSVDEQSGGNFVVRLTGWDAHNLEHMQTYLCTESNTYILQYLLTLGTAIALANRPE